VVLATPLDFFLWGVLKERAYQIPVLTIEKLKITPEALREVQRSFLNRVDACLLQNGMYVEQFLRKS
jgi:hypothetical protein